MLKSYEEVVRARGSSSPCECCHPKWYALSASDRERLGLERDFASTFAAKYWESPTNFRSWVRHASKCERAGRADRSIYDPEIAEALRRRLDRDWQDASARDDIDDEITIKFHDQDETLARALEAQRLRGAEDGRRLSVPYGAVLELHRLLKHAQLALQRDDTAELAGLLVSIGGLSDEIEHAESLREPHRKLIAPGRVDTYPIGGLAKIVGTSIEADFEWRLGDLTHFRFRRRGEH